MKRIERLADEMEGFVTYEVGENRYLRLSVHDIQDYGLAACLQAHDIDPPTERLPVIHRGKRIGTMPPDFDPVAVRSKGFLYDPRPGDFIREGDTWVASKSLGSGDLDLVVGFVREEANPGPQP